MTNREKAEAAFAAFQRGDLDAGFAETHPEWEFDNRTDAPGASGVWRGRDGFVEMIGRVTEGFSEYELERLGVTEDGDRVTIAVRERARGLVSGIEIERRIYLTYTFREGKNVRTVASMQPPEG